MAASAIVFLVPIPAHMIAFILGHYGNLSVVARHLL